jgi:hypothetical protein
LAGKVKAGRRRGGKRRSGGEVVNDVRKERVMRRVPALVGLAALIAVIASVTAPAASAFNGPTFRDCSLAEGLDPSFVQLFGVRVGIEGAHTSSRVHLWVPRGKEGVHIEASEPPGDNLARVALEVAVTSPDISTRNVSGEGTGEVLLAVPLRGSGKVGRTYTINWAATFDNGNHPCPSEFTPENTTPEPFEVTVFSE